MCYTQVLVSLKIKVKYDTGLKVGNDKIAFAQN